MTMALHDLMWIKYPFLEGGLLSAQEIYLGREEGWEMKLQKLKMCQI